MQVRLPIHSPIKVVPEILSVLLTSIARYILIANSDIRDAITWFRERSSLNDI
jgi:phage gp36-like protein